MSTDPLVWVFVEVEEGGRLSRASAAVLRATAQIAAAAQTEAAAIVCGPVVDGVLDRVAACGIEHLYGIADVAPEAHVEDLAAHIAGAASELRPRVFLFADTLLTRDLAPRIAARLAVGLISHCVEVGVDQRLTLRGYKPLASGICETTAVCEDSFVQMATLIPSPQVGASPRVAGDVQVRTWRATFPVRDGAARGKRVRRIVSEPPGAADLCDAEVIVGVGHGIGSPRFLPVVEALAQQLGAPVGCTRKVAEQGWLPRAHQIGTSGKTVSPRVYVAIAVSGSVQHMLGVRHSETIIAVNTDPHAPIIRAAHLGVVGDALEVVPALTKALQQRVHTIRCSPAEMLCSAM